MSDQTLAGAIDKAAREALAQLTRVQREQVLEVLEYVRDHTVTPRKALEVIDERILTGCFKASDLPSHSEVAERWLRVMDHLVSLLAEVARRAQCEPGEIEWYS